jgi:outer membrane protein
MRPALQFPVAWRFAGILLMELGLLAAGGCTGGGAARPGRPASELSLAAAAIGPRQQWRRAAEPERAILVPTTTLGSSSKNESMLLAANHPKNHSAVWWNDQVGMALRDRQDAVEIDLGGLVYEALAHSDQIKSLRAVPLAVAQEIYIAESEFDIKAFVESKFRDISDPVSDTLTTGGPPRLNEHRWAFDGGVRRRLTSGATVSLSQQLGHTNSNSLFFLPNDQGSARLALNVTQPLFRGVGKEYNRSLIILARLDRRIANDDFERELQKHLLDISDAYWTLYAERAGLIQRKRNLERASRLAKELEARKVMDATASQVIRVHSALARRRADLVRSDARIRNLESRLGQLTNSPVLTEGIEVVPQELPLPLPLQTDARLATEEALRHRPEVDAAFQQVRAAQVRLNVTEQELLPYLNLVLETYVYGREGRSEVGTAWLEQFGDGAPSYTAGFTFEAPFGNRAARARHEKRRLELAHATHGLRNTLGVVASEVNVAVREVRSFYEEIAAKEKSVAAALAEVNHLESRWHVLAGDDRTASLVLEDLLLAHERLLEEEQSLAQSLAMHSISVLQLRRATGTLLDHEERFRSRNAPAAPEEIPAPAKPVVKGARHAAAYRN